MSGERNGGSGQGGGSDGTVDVAVVSIRPSQTPADRQASTDTAPASVRLAVEMPDASALERPAPRSSNSPVNADEPGHDDFARPALRRRRAGRPKGPPAQRITYELHREDAELFRDLCDDAWDGCTYKEGFRRLLTLAGVRPGLGKAPNAEDEDGPASNRGHADPRASRS